MHSRGMLKFAFGEIKSFLEEQYWQPILNKLKKREANLAEFKQKLDSFRVVSDIKYKLPPF